MTGRPTIGASRPRVRAVRRGAAAGVWALLLSTAALAAEPHGCDGFTWPVAQAQAALAAPDLPLVALGGGREVGPGAFTLVLAPADATTLPMPPERASRISPSFVGFARFAAPREAGLYQVTLSEGVWVDLVQNNAYLKPAGFSGALDCPGVRKLVRFRLAASPFVLQVSGATVGKIGVIVDRVPDATH